MGCGSLSPHLGSILNDFTSSRGDRMVDVKAVRGKLNQFSIIGHVKKEILSVELTFSFLRDAKSIEPQVKRSTDL